VFSVNGGVKGNDFTSVQRIHHESSRVDPRRKPPEMGAATRRSHPTKISTDILNYSSKNIWPKISVDYFK